MHVDVYHNTWMMPIATPCDCNSAHLHEFVNFTAPPCIALAANKRVASISTGGNAVLVASSCGSVLPPFAQLILLAPALCTFTDVHSTCLNLGCLWAPAVVMHSQMLENTLPGEFVLLVSTSGWAH